VKHSIPIFVAGTGVARARGPWHSRSLKPPGGGRPLVQASARTGASERNPCARQAMPLTRTLFVPNERFMAVVQTHRELRVPHRVNDGAVHFQRVTFGHQFCLPMSAS
jgi:hypothetical protein